MQSVAYSLAEMQLDILNHTKQHSWGINLFCWHMISMYSLYIKGNMVKNAF